MSPSSADPDTIAVLRRLAAAVQFSYVSPQALSDMMAHKLKLEDVADAIVEWIDIPGRVKPTTIHSIPGRKGDPAYELKPSVNGTTWYIKVCIDDRNGPEEGLALLSAHSDHC